MWINRRIKDWRREAAWINVGLRIGRLPLILQPGPTLKSAVIAYAGSVATRTSQARLISAPAARSTGEPRAPPTSR